MKDRTRFETGLAMLNQIDGTAGQQVVEALQSIARI